MPNLHVTDRQVMLYMTRSQQHDQESAAAMAGFSARTARRIDKDPRLPSQKRQPRTWRTRTDPLTDVWPRTVKPEAANGGGPKGQALQPDGGEQTIELAIR